MASRRKNTTIRENSTAMSVNFDRTSLLELAEMTLGRGRSSLDVPVLSRWPAGTAGHGREAHRHLRSRPRTVLPSPMLRLLSYLHLPSRYSLADRSHACNKGRRRDLLLFIWFATVRWGLGRDEK
ncbi:hypothetical protein BHM03_00023011 [Ensete ventricosum]|nr:hypothetical protein BHM03_00023011 [Ensete ventricosum]